MIFYCVTIALLIFIDQIVKFLVDRHMIFGDTIPVIGDFFHITYVQNRGIAFGIFQGKVDIISIATVIAIILIIVYFLKNVKKFNFFERTAYLFIISGAVGNMIDRLLRGYVVDMIDFRGIWSFVFNIADVYINLGVILLLLDLLVKRRKD
ncbi:signal peptidase II [Fusobacterium sp.]|uniref:signal peptidase II n=1 Tax=Fusobacterium sp. TaxID=68766 RepID=UPI002636DA9D|nr:signal peptidase II [Fusobacterium sp.]